MVKHLQSRGVKRADAEGFVTTYNSRNTDITDGAKVRINVVRIKKNGGWDELNPHYKEFVLANKNTLFTAIKDEHTFVLEEDTTEPRWKFIAADLDLIEAAPVEVHPAGGGGDGEDKPIEG